MSVIDAPTERPIGQPSRWPRRLHNIGAGSIGLIGIAHLLAIHVFEPVKPADEQQIANLSAIATTSLFEGGREVSVLDLNTGYSVGMGAFGVMFAVLVIAAAQGAPKLMARGSLFSLACFVTAATLFAIAALYFPEVVVILAALSTVCFGYVLVAGAPRSF